MHMAKYVLRGLHGGLGLTIPPKTHDSSTIPCWFKALALALAPAVVPLHVVGRGIDPEQAGRPLIDIIPSGYSAADQTHAHSTSTSQCCEKEVATGSQNHTDCKYVPFNDHTSSPRL
jgi:hypothetical protein